MIDLVEGREQLFGFSDYEKQFMSILRNIYENGYTDGTNQRTGHETKRLPNQVIRVDLQKEFPIIKSKKVKWEIAGEEILWIMQKFSNNIHDLNAKIWDKWADEDGSIGKSYGYQVGGPVRTKVNGVEKIYNSQPEYVLETLRRDPSDRRCIITLWNRLELADMNLNPCCHTSTWNLDGGKLNCLLDQRSGDFPVGVPFNTTQYAELTYAFAQDLGVPVGDLLHVIADAHIYDNQMEDVKRWLDNYDKICRGEQVLNLKGEPIKDSDGNIITSRAILASEPKFEFINKKLNFWQQSTDNMMVSDYVNGGFLKIEVVE